MNRCVHLVGDFDIVLIISMIMFLIMLHIQLISREHHAIY